jgi:hypothetical protein
MGFVTAAMAFLKGIPWKVWAAMVAFALVAGAFRLYGEARYRDGQADVQGRWDEATTAQAEADRQAQDQQEVITTRTVTQYVDRVKIVREKGDTIVQQVPIYVPSDSPLLPAGWRVLHDAAATGNLPPPPGSFAAAPVEPRAAAETVAGNYARCHEDHAGYDALWQWAEQQAAVGAP